MTLLAVTAIARGYEFRCPACEQCLGRVLADRTEATHGHWFRDGDTIPDVWGRLTDEQRTPDGVAYELLVGCCSRCGSHYCAVLAEFMDARMEVLLRYVSAPGTRGAERNLICCPSAPSGTIPAAWLMQEYETPDGVLHSHLFGPWVLDDPASVCGPFGVSACGEGDATPWAHGRALLLALWDPLRELHRQRAHPVSTTSAFSGARESGRPPAPSGA